MTAERISYNGWENVWRIRNGSITMLVTADVGPRILHFGFEDDENELYEVAEQAGLTGGDEFRMYGGHRLWVAPETERTEYPDNRPVEVQRSESSVAFIAPAETNGLQKTISIELADGPAQARIVHTIRNTSEADTNVSAWALTVMKPGGRALLPLPPAAPHGPQHLLPVAAITLWSYTDLTAPCWQLGPKFITLQQNAVSSHGFGMQKLGMLNKAGWGAYVQKERVFTKRITWADGVYVDWANFEVFANKQFLEIESLSPDQKLRPGQTCVHVEEWSLTSLELFALDNKLFT